MPREPCFSTRCGCGLVAPPHALHKPLTCRYFQVVRYEKGQYYLPHHDQQTAHWAPQGPRVYTFYLYLSDVEAGGGTRFGDLDEHCIEVQPKLGRGLLWPSVREDDVTSGEIRTIHEAAPVEAGIKCGGPLRPTSLSTPESAPSNEPPSA